MKRIVAFALVVAGLFVVTTAARAGGPGAFGSPIQGGPSVLSIPNQGQPSVLAIPHHGEPSVLGVPQRPIPPHQQGYFTLHHRRPVWIQPHWAWNGWSWVW